MECYAVVFYTDFMYNEYDYLVMGHDELICACLDYGQ